MKASARVLTLYRTAVSLIFPESFGWQIPVLSSLFSVTCWLFSTLRSIREVKQSSRESGNFLPVMEPGVHYHVYKSSQLYLVATSLIQFCCPVRRKNVVCGSLWPSVRPVRDLASASQPFVAYSWNSVYDFFSKVAVRAWVCEHGPVNSYALCLQS